MSASEAYRNLRAGIIYATASVPASTVRTWTASEPGLKVGYRENPAAHPRYDLGDAARLLLMNFLTSRLKMQASAAIHIVNAAQAQITLAADAALLKLDTGEDSKFKEYIVAFMKADGVEKPDFRTPEQHANWIKDGAIVLETVIDLCALISLTMAQFKNAEAIVGLQAITAKAG